MRGLGASCDWARERFTMDAGYVRVIRTVFAEVYRQGLVYRGPRIVNWATRCERISDEEVAYEQQQDTFDHVRYQLIWMQAESRWPPPAPRPSSPMPVVVARRWALRHRL